MESAVDECMGQSESTGAAEDPKRRLGVSHRQRPLGRRVQVGQEVAQNNGRRGLVDLLFPFDAVISR